MRNRNSDLQIPLSDALLLSSRDFMMSEAHYEVHIYGFHVFFEYFRIDCS